MKPAILALSFTTAVLLSGAYYLFDHIPTATPSQVIGEKGTMGGTNTVIRVPPNLTEKQNALLTMAYKSAKAEGFSNPEIMQTILLQETRAGAMKSYKVANPGSEAYYGPMQIKLAAARDVLSRFPALWDKYEFHTKTDDEVKANLILNEEFNVEVAAKYVHILQRIYRLQGRELINAYNRGPGGVKRVNSQNFHYAIEGEKKLQTIKNGGRV